MLAYLKSVALTLLSKLRPQIRPTLNISKFLLYQKPTPE